METGCEPLEGCHKRPGTGDLKYNEQMAQEFRGEDSGETTLTLDILDHLPIGGSWRWHLDHGIR